MRILQGRLEAPELDFAWDPDRVTGARITPELIVIHYAVTDSLEDTGRALKASDYVSAHLSVDGFSEGNRSVHRVRQHVNFGHRAGHAGPTALYHGRPGVNGFSIGIEIANPGPLLEREGKLFTTYGKEWKEPAILGTHPRNRAPASWTHWAAYTNEEYSLIAALCRELIATYPTIVDIVGHDEIRQDKYDPGPAFAMGWLRSVCGIEPPSLDSKLASRIKR
jgi:N-acetylmuramoyl-L-alanine amidase